MTEARGDNWIQKNHHAIESLAFTAFIIGVYFILPLLHISVPQIPEFAFMAIGVILGVTAWKHGEVNKIIAQGQKGVEDGNK